MPRLPPLREFLNGTGVRDIDRQIARSIVEGYIVIINAIAFNKKGVIVHFLVNNGLKV